MKDNKKKKSIIIGVTLAVIVIVIIVFLLRGCNAGKQASGSSAVGGIASAETVAKTEGSVDDNKNSADESVISDGETDAASDLTVAADKSGASAVADGSKSGDIKKQNPAVKADSSKVEPASQEAPNIDVWTQTNDGYEGTVHNSSVDKVRYGTGDDSPSYDNPGFGDDRREEESESDAPVTPPVNPPIVPPEEITDDALPTKDDIVDYDDYERLTKEQRDSIKSSFSSPMAYTVWLNGLIQKRLDKITDGAVGYGDEIHVD